MTTLDHLKGILSASACLLGIFCLMLGLSIQRFIVKRYQTETDLSQTKYFSELMPFARYLPNFFSSPLYIGHLLTFAWGWRFVRFIKEKRKKIKYYDDINSPEDVTIHFSKKEIRRVKLFALTGFIIVTHGVAYLVLQSIWPQVFD